jgi:hypothetical protein
MFALAWLVELTNVNATRYHPLPTKDALELVTEAFAFTAPVCKSTVIQGYAPVAVDSPRKDTYRKVPAFKYTDVVYVVAATTATVVP